MRAFEETYDGFLQVFSLKQIHSNPGIALNLVSTYYPSETIWMSTGGYL